MDRLLILDDNPAVLTSLSLLFSLRGYHCLTATHPNQALQLLEQENIALVVADMNFESDNTSGEEGKQFFYAARRLQPDLPVVLLTGWVDLSIAVELVKAGAADYLSKPWDDDKLLVIVANLLELRALNQLQQAQQQSRIQARELLAQKYDLAGVLYQSDAMQQLLSMALQIAKADVPVLITGPNGAGKEKIAELVQRNSAVAKGPFVRVNAGSIPLDLMEAELFGAEPGAYTGIKQPRIGHFEMADGGTLFLDEIGNLPLGGQMKLLRVLQTGEFQRLGSSQVRTAKVRLITATNSDLPAAIARGEFREDLYYRLNVIELNLPPLAERKEDILPLARHFLQGRAISTAALRQLEAHDWPGNVRELQNCIKRACLLTETNLIEAKDLHLPEGIKPKSRPLFEPDEAQLRSVLHTSCSIAEAARNLGMSRQALYRRMEKFAIDPESLALDKEL